MNEDYYSVSERVYWVILGCGICIQHQNSFLVLTLDGFKSPLCFLKICYQILITFNSSIHYSSKKKMKGYNITSGKILIVSTQTES